MGRFLGIALAVWSLVAMPGVCLSGWMSDACVCGEPGCGGSHDSCPGGHGCPDDPCSVQAVRSGDQDDMPGADFLPTVALTDPVFPGGANPASTANRSVPLTSFAASADLVPGITPLLL
jgi:hypothetical protein